MKDIDYYIQKSKNMDGGVHRTKVYPFVEEKLILVCKYQEDYEELKKRIAICHDKGVNIPLYFDYKQTEDQFCWILEELAPGHEFFELVEQNKNNIDKLVDSIPYEHILKYMEDVFLLNLNGIGVEPRRRNIFYDEKLGFTTIDVAALHHAFKPDSLRSAWQFFSTFSRVFLFHFSDDEYGKKVEEKTIINVMKAIESVYPNFDKYKRWIYRDWSYYGNYLEAKGYDLTLDSEEYNQLINYIESLIDTLVQEIIDNPENIFIIRETSYVYMLESSIKYCKNFDYFDSNNLGLRDFIDNEVYNRIKDMFLANPNDEKLRLLYIEIRKKELDPLNVYYEEYTLSLINEEIDNILSKGKTK